MREIYDWMHKVTTKNFKLMSNSFSPSVEVANLRTRGEGESLRTGIPPERNAAHPECFVIVNFV